MIQPGDRIRDNDPRMPNRVYLVTSVRDGVVIASSYGRETKVRLNRVFTDGKPRRYGWNRVSEPQTTGATP